MNRKKIIFVTLFAILFNLCTFSVIKAENKDKDKDKDKKDIYLFNFEDWEYEPNFRTVVVLDIAVFRNFSEIRGMDYRPEFNKDYILSIELYKQADMKEFVGVHEPTNPRDAVYTDGKSDDYAYKLKRLIDHNIMTRDAFYFANENEAKMGLDLNTYKGEQKK